MEIKHIKKKGLMILNTYGIQMSITDICVKKGIMLKDIDTERNEYIGQTIKYFSATIAK